VAPGARTAGWSSYALSFFLGSGAVPPHTAIESHRLPDSESRAGGRRRLGFFSKRMLSNALGERLFGRPRRGRSEMSARGDRWRGEPRPEALSFAFSGAYTRPSGIWLPDNAGRSANHPNALA